MSKNAPKKKPRSKKAELCPIKVSVNLETKKLIAANALNEIKTYPDGGLMKWKNDTVFNVEVYIFSSETNFSMNTITHATITFWTKHVQKNKDDEFIGYNFEYGNPSSPITYNKEIGYYSYPKQSWFGILLEEEFDSPSVKLEDVFYNASAWKVLFGKGGQYPYNCRGYVDFALRNLFCLQVNWKNLKLEPVLKCVPSPFG